MNSRDNIDRTSVQRSPTHRGNSRPSSTKLLSAFTWLMRALKGLEGAISPSVRHWHMGENGWTFDSGSGVIPDPIHNAKYLYEIYLADDSKSSGRATTPVLWNKAQARLVNNESAEIMRMFNDGFDDVALEREITIPNLYEARLIRSTNAFIRI
jgi:glutathionyl-hydroquinone reductase